MKRRKIVVSFIPVIHRGYLDFLVKAGTKSICIVEASDIPELSHLVREIRALRFEETRKILCALGFRVMRFSEARVAIKESGDGAVLIMPKEDVSYVLYERHFQDMKVEFLPTFLRWDWNRSTGVIGSQIPDADRVIHRGDLEMGEILPRMEILLREREKSSDWWRQVAAMAVCKDGTTIIAYNKHFPHEYVPYFDGDPRNNFGPGEYIEVSIALHAECGVIAQVAKDGIALKEADMYVTTFPCGGCANQIAASGVRRVFFTGGYSNLNGVKTLRDHGVELIYVEP